MQFLDHDKIEQRLNYTDLIAALKKGFHTPPTVPTRLHYHYDNGQQKQQDNTLLLMPAWQEGEQLGVKLVVVAPDNHQHGLGAIQGVYMLFDAVTGLPKAVMDAKTITNWRTACTSALASSFLSRQDSRTLLMVGSGALAPYLIQAHSAVRPIDRVLLWSRTAENAIRLTKEMSDKSIPITTINTIEEGMAEADIICCATLSHSPLILGKHLKSGQHVDLVGAYKPDMREADHDPAAIRY